MKFNYIILIVLLFVTGSCSKENRPGGSNQPQKTFMSLYADMLEVEISQESLPTSLGSGFQVKGMMSYGDELFCTNLATKRIDIFNNKTFQYIESIVDAQTAMFSRDVYVDNKYVYVTGTSNPRSQVSIYDRLTKKYICRLGNGLWAGELVHPISVTASEKYIFVRDQGTSIKVFLKSDVIQGRSLVTYCRLNIDGQLTNNADNYDMSVVDSTLYAVNIRNKTIYEYPVNTVYGQNTEVAYSSKFVYPDNQSPKAISASDKYMFITTSAAYSRINIYRRGTVKIKLEKPDFTISSFSGVDMSNINFIASKGDTLFLNSTDQKVSIAHIKERLYIQTGDSDSSTL